VINVRNRFEFPKEVMEKTIKNIRKKYKEIKSVENVKNQLLGVQVKNKSTSVKSYAINYIICLLFSNILMVTLRKTVQMFCHKLSLH
jgi:RNA processing factor Prp31